MCLLSCNPDRTQTGKSWLQILHSTTRRSSAFAWLVWTRRTTESFTGRYGMENRFRRSDEGKAFIIKKVDAVSAAAAAPDDKSVAAIDREAEIALDDEAAIGHVEVADGERRVSVRHGQ